jgi:hypothetical protein
VPQHCPKEVAASIVEAAVYLDFSPCTGIVHVPRLADGKLVATAGYHEPTGLILDLHDRPPVIPALLVRRLLRRR